MTIDSDAILAPISEEEPCGRYTRSAPFFDEIKNARRADDPAFATEGEGKVSEWGKVISLCTSALANESKDLLLGAWLTEALVIKERFPGLAQGCAVLEGLLERYWESVHPPFEDEDDYPGRAAPFQYLDRTVAVWVGQIPLTDPKLTPGFGLYKYTESRTVGYESAADSDKKRQQRGERIADGQLTAEQFDVAVNKSPVSFYKKLAEEVAQSLEAFLRLEAVVDAKFAAAFGEDNIPAMLKLRQVLEECNRLVQKICKEQKGLQEALQTPAPGGDAPAGGDAGAPPHQEEGSAPAPVPAAAVGAVALPSVPLDADALETQLWTEALRIHSGGGFRKALDLLLAAATSQPSERGRRRYRFLVAKLCLKAGHPELARPIVEELHTLVGELQLEKWESPFWISEILEALHQCLTTGEDADEEAGRAKELFKKICTLDVTKALKSESQRRS